MVCMRLLLPGTTRSTHCPGCVRCVGTKLSDVDGHSSRDREIVAENRPQEKPSLRLGDSTLHHLAC